MNHSALSLRGVVAALVLFQLSACGGTDPSGDEPPPNDAADLQDTGERNAAPLAETGSAEGASSAATQPFSLGVADLDAYERGLRREMEILRSAGERFANAPDDEEQLDILGEIQPQVLRQAGAEAAGVPEDRYRNISSAINDVLGKLEMGEASQQMIPSEEDLAEMPPEVRAQVEENVRQMRAAWGDPYEGLEPATADALEARVDELRSLRAEHVGLLLNVGR